MPAAGIGARTAPDRIMSIVGSVGEPVITVKKVRTKRKVTRDPDTYTRIKSGDQSATGGSKATDAGARPRTFKDSVSLSSFSISHVSQDCRS